VRWSKILTGKARPDIDKFLDDFIKDVDENLLKNCITYCRDRIDKIHDNIELILDFYENNLGLVPTRYTLGYIMYTYLDEEDQIKMVKLAMRRHDSWRLFDPCIVLRYMYEKYGRDGVEITIVHMVLDEIARLCKISFTDARRGIETMVTVLQEIAREYEIEELLHRIEKKLTEIIIDVAFSIGINLRTISPIKHILLIKNHVSTIDLKRLNNLETYRIGDLSPEKSIEIINIIRKVSKRYRIRVNVKYNPISGLIETSHDMILIPVLKTCREDISIVYPHVVNVYSVGEIIINIEDYVRDLAVMRPGSMRDDLKGGH